MPTALIDGFAAAFLAGAIIAAVGIVAALTLIRREELEHVAGRRAGARPRGLATPVRGGPEWPAPRCTVTGSRSPRGTG